MKTVIDGISINSNKEILLVKKGDKWILPWGKLDWDETELDCLKREITEELNNLQISLQINHYKNFTWITPTSKTPILCKTYFIELLDEVLITPSAEIIEAKYTKDFDSLVLSDVTRDIITTLQQDWYL